MGDNVKYQTVRPATPDAATVVAADVVDGVAYQRMKIATGADGVIDGDVSTANPLPIIPGDGVAVEEIAGDAFQRVKLALGADGVDDEDVSIANPMPVKITSSTNMDGGGSVAVGTTAVEVTFTGVTSAIIISSPLSNTGTLYVGKSTVTSAGANAFAFLEAGESLTIEYDDTDNAVYVVASIAAQTFFKGALL